LGDLADSRVDLAVVGAGIVGLAHALHGVDRGLRVAVVEREANPVGASIRNFGHGYVEAQAGEAFEYGLAARELWLRIAAEAGFWASETGTLLVARRPEELAVVEEFAADRGSAARVLGPGEALARAAVSPEGLLGALWTPGDIRVDPRVAVPKMADWLAERGVAFHWQTTAVAAETGRLVTNRGELEADAVVLAAGPWTGRIPGLRLPRVHGLKGYSVTLEAAGVPAHALFMDYRLADGRALEPEIIPRPDGTVYICGMADRQPLPECAEGVEVSEAGCAILAGAAARVAASLAAAPIRRRQACYRPVVDDGLPMIGPVPAVRGAYVATGHGPWGMLNAPATGLALTELIADGAARSVDLRPFYPDRLRPARS